MTTDKFSGPTEALSAASGTAANADTSHNLLADSRAYDCKPNAIEKVITYGDEMVVRGAVDAWLGSKVGARLGGEGATVGVVIGAIIGAGSGVTDARWQLKGKEAACLEQHRKS